MPNNVYYKRVEINGDVNNLPKKEEFYFVKCKGKQDWNGMDIMELIDPDDPETKELWVNTFDWYLLPVSTPETIVGPTEEELSLMLDQYNYKTSKEREDAYDLIKYTLSQLKIVDKNDLIQYIINLLSAAYIHESDSGKFDIWLNEQMDILDDYLSGKEEEGK